MTDPEKRWKVSAPHGDYLGHRLTGQEKGRGTLQTSALPLGYGAEASKVTKSEHFLNPPETFQESSSLLWVFLGVICLNHKIMRGNHGCLGGFPHRAIRPFGNR
jgi:hypothetical protein